MNAFVLTRHAYERYCERVEPIERQKLIEMLERHLSRASPHKRGFIEANGVWWRYGIRNGTMILYTCYGRHFFDLPAAIKWAKRYRDRINLGGGEAR